MIVLMDLLLENEIIAQVSNLGIGIKVPEEIVNFKITETQTFEDQFWDHVLGIFRRKELISSSACTGAMEIIKQISEYIPKHPKIEFRFVVSCFDENVDFQLEYSNGLDRVKGALNPNPQIVISVKDVLIEEKFFDEFEEWLKTTSFAGSIFKISDAYYVQFSGGRLVNFNYFPPSPSGQYAECVCPTRAWCGVLTNGAKFGEERVRRLIQVAMTGCLDAIYPGSKTELLTACKGHTGCEFEGSKECQGDLEVVTTFIKDDYWHPKVEGAFYCAKHAPPGLKSPLYWIADYVATREVKK